SMNLHLAGPSETLQDRFVTIKLAFFQACLERLKRGRHNEDRNCIRKLFLDLGSPFRINIEEQVLTLGQDLFHESSGSSIVLVKYFSVFNELFFFNQLLKGFVRNEEILHSILF